MLDLWPAVDELIVVAAHGTQWEEQCLDSLGDANVLVRHTEDGGHPTGAYRWVYENHPADRYLFIQDSMTAVADPLPWFRSRWEGSGAVAWQRFPMQWDSDEQIRWVESRYSSHPTHGIFGPVFYTDRASLDVLQKQSLMPPVPTSRMEAQATERAWAYAFAQAELPVIGPDWSPTELVAGDVVGPFRKVFANRP